MMFALFIVVIIYLAEFNELEITILLLYVLYLFLDLLGFINRNCICNFKAMIIIFSENFKPYFMLVTWNYTSDHVIFVLVVLVIYLLYYSLITIINLFEKLLAGTLYLLAIWFSEICLQQLKVYFIIHSLSKHNNVRKNFKILVIVYYFAIYQSFINILLS